MMGRKPLFVALWLCANSFANPYLDSPRAVTVSPGGIEGPTLIAETCPTFSWGQTAGATRYEVVIFDTGDSAGSDYTEHEAIAGPFLQAGIEAPALSWTPGADQCLYQDGTYLWFVRAITPDGIGDWSQGRRFVVDMTESSLVEVVRQEVTNQLTQPGALRELIQEVLRVELENAPVPPSAALANAMSAGDAAAQTDSTDAADKPVSGTIGQTAPFRSPSASFRTDGAVIANDTITASRGEGPNLVIEDSNGGASRTGIQFTNNQVHYISGDDDANEIFSLQAQFSDQRTHDALLRIHGDTQSTGDSWGNFLGISHDGTDGVISTDNGAIRLSPESALVEVVGEARTVDSENRPRLWGKGRPGAERHGRFIGGLCSNWDIVFGLSKHAVDWGSVEHACPLETWVCSAAERGIFLPCNTIRSDGNRDAIACDGSDVNWPSDEHWGWISGGADEETGMMINENGLFDTAKTCLFAPVWCCSGPN